MLQHTHPLRARCSSRPSPARCQRLPHRRLAVKAVVTAPADGQQATQQAGPASQSQGYRDAVLVQSFGWDSCEKGGTWYKTIQSKVPDLKDLTCTHLWLPPPSQSVSAQGYMPGQLYNLNSKYGNAEALKELVKVVKEAGIVPVADIVINHRCADEMVDGKWNKFRDDVTHDGRKIDWGKWAITGNDPVFGGTGNPDTGDDYGPAPDLDHLNPDLRAALKDWLKWLQDDIGFGGWRLDFVKGYGAKYVEEYLAATVGGEVFNVGEYWVDMEWSGCELNRNQDAARQRLCDWLNASQKTCTAFDFPTKGILQEALKKNELWRLNDGNGKPPGLMGWWPSRAVTFVDNHDTGSTQNHWPFVQDRVGAGYAYIMTHPGIPCVFWDHYFTWGAELRNIIHTLAAIRRRNGIMSDSKVKIMAAESDMYVAEIGESVVLKLGPRYDMGACLPKECDGWKTATWGKDFCVWERNGPCNK